MTDAGVFFTILYDVMCAFLMDTYGLFSSSLSIQAHKRFGLKVSRIYDMFLLGQEIIFSE